MFTMVGARALLPCCFCWRLARLAAAHVHTYVVSAMSASTKEFRDRDHVVDKCIYIQYVGGPVSGFAACTAGHSLFDRTKTKNDYYDILRVSQRLYSARMPAQTLVGIHTYLPGILPNDSNAGFGG